MDAAAGAADAALILGGFDGAGVRETPLLAQVNRTKSWFTATDCSVDPKNCTVGGNEAPRVFDGTPFCTKGTTAARDGLNFGASVALSFENGFDANALGLVGFSFDLTGTAPATIDISVVSSAPKAAFADGEAGLAAIGHRFYLRLDQLKPATPTPPFDPSMLEFISFSVPVDSVAVPFDYCVANVSTLSQ